MLWRTVSAAAKAPDVQFKSPLDQSTMDNICGGQKTQLLYLVIEMTLSKTSFMPLYPLYPIYPFPPRMLII